MQIQNNNLLLDKAISIIDKGRKNIVEDEQQGENKAQYGKGFSTSTLKDCRKFYIKSQSLTDQLHYNTLNSTSQTSSQCSPRKVF